MTVKEPYPPALLHFSEYAHGILIVMAYYNDSVGRVLDDLETSRSGLDSFEIERRRAEHGKNTIQLKGVPLWRRLIAPFANILMGVLGVAAILSLYHGDVLDATIIIAIICANAIIYYVQTVSTDRILKSLRTTDKTVVTTVRAGGIEEVPEEDLVIGDIIQLGEGEKVPADARVVRADGVQVDESILTGESVPMVKIAEQLKGEKQVYERANMLHQGSFVVSGEATAVVVAIGSGTEFGSLARLANGGSNESPVQIKIDNLVKKIISVIGGVALVGFGLALYRGMELLEALKYVIAIAVSAVPEGLPVAISVILVLGMRRMAAKKALIRDMRAIETIGVVTAVASDKTGTLTENKLRIQEIWSPHSDTNLQQTLIRASNNTRRRTTDPLDSAIEQYCVGNKIAAPKGDPFKTLPFEQASMMSGNAWHHGADYDIYIKGAPEQVINVSDMTVQEQEIAHKKILEFTSNGYRVIALAHRRLQSAPHSLAEIAAQKELFFDGLIAVADTIRPEAIGAIKRAAQAGISVRMITGDHYETAYSVGRQLGIVTDKSQVFDCRGLNKLTDGEVEQLTRTVNVFSRVVPEQKYRLLSILKRRHITAMTGDGVNDVPALTNAHVGVAMGAGSHIAKDAGDIVLLDNNFKTIIDAIHEGRIIFANIRRMIFYLLSTNVGELLTFLGALVIGVPAPLAAVQILWINLVTDTAMVIPLGMEPGEKHIMKQKPEKPNAPILTKYTITRMILVAISMAILTLGAYIYYRPVLGDAAAGTVAYHILVFMQIANAFNARSDFESVFTHLKVKNTAFYAGLILSFVLQLLALFGPLREALHIASVPIEILLIAGGMAIVVPIAIVEIHKWYGRRRILNR